MATFTLVMQYAISVSYGIANKYGGKFNLRFDDTNPLKEDMEYVHSIIEDMKWGLALILRIEFIMVLIIQILYMNLLLS